MRFFLKDKNGKVGKVLKVSFKFCLTLALCQQAYLMSSILSTLM